MKEKDKKMLGYALDGVILVGFIIALVFAFKAGYQEGQKAFCAENGLTLVNLQGVAECWDDFRVEEYKNQWEVNTNYGLQLNFT